MRAVTAAVVLLGACTTIPEPPSPEAARIEILVDEPVSATRNLVLAAFNDEGLSVEEASDVVLTTQGVEIAGDVWAVYRANLVAVGDTSTEVVLSGLVRNAQGASAASAILGGAAVETPEYPLHNEMTGDRLGGAWQRLEAVAEILRHRDR